MSSLKKIGKFVFRYKLQTIFSIVFMLLYSIFTAAPAHYTKAMFDSLIESIKEGELIPFHQLVMVGMAIILLISLKGIAFFLQTYLMGSVAQKTIRELRQILYQKTISLPLVYFNKKSTGELSSRFTIDFVTLNEALIVGFVGPLRDVPLIVLLIINMYDKSWHLTIATIILLPIVAKLLSVFGKQSRKATDKRLNQFGELSTLISETITGIRVVKAFIMERYEINRFKKENHRLFKHFMLSTFINAYSYPLIELTAGIFFAFILPYAGYLINTGKITFGDFMSFAISFTMLNTPLKALNGISIKIQEGLTAADRIFEILDSDMKIEEKENAVEMRPIEKEIRVRIKKFGYAEKIVLQDLDLTLKAGTITALVGSSGSGKTTLANLIPRFYDIKP